LDASRQWRPPKRPLVLGRGGSFPGPGRSRRAPEPSPRRPGSAPSAGTNVAASRPAADWPVVGSTWFWSALPRSGYAARNFIARRAILRVLGAEEWETR